MSSLMSDRGFRRFTIALLVLGVVWCAGGLFVYRGVVVEAGRQAQTWVEGRWAWAMAWWPEEEKVVIEDSDPGPATHWDHNNHRLVLDNDVEITFGNQTDNSLRLGYANDAAYEGVRELECKRHGVVCGKIPEGATYYRLSDDTMRYYDGKKWQTYIPSGGDVRLADAYSNGSTITKMPTSDEGRIVFGSDPQGLDITFYSDIPADVIVKDDAPIQFGTVINQKLREKESQMRWEASDE